MVPEGWVRAPVNEYGEVSAGRQRSPNFKNGKLRPYLRVANVFEGYIDTSDINEMVFTDKEYERYQLKAGDILLNEGQSTELVGRPAMYEGDPPNCCFQNTLVRFKGCDNVDREFSLQRFLLCLYDGTFQRISKKTTSIAHLGVSRFADLVLAWPPLKEQQKIAKILSAWDKAIATMEQLLANSEQQKKALMQQLLTGKKRLPGFESEWENIALGKLFSERKETGIAGLSLLSVTSDQGVINRDDVGRKDTSSADKSRYLRVCPGDIAYNTMRMWQGVSALSGLEGIVSPAYTVLKPESAANSQFFAYLFKLPGMVHRFYRHSQGLVSDTWNLKYKQFARIKVLVPGLKEQEAIAEVLSKVDETISCLEEQLGNLAGEKKALMQQLLTGKRRVKVDEAERATA